MKLSGEQFQQIVAQLTSDHREAGQDKRSEPRVGVRAQGYITPWTLDDSAAQRIPVTIRDLSPAGICILASGAMTKGSRFVLRLLCLGQSSLLVQYEVRYSKLLAPTLFAIGAKLVKLSNSAGEADAA